MSSALVLLAIAAVLAGVAGRAALSMGAQRVLPPATHAAPVGISTTVELPALPASFGPPVPSAERRPAAG